jgi:hypothetical protein
VLSNRCLQDACSRRSIRTLRQDHLHGNEGVSGSSPQEVVELRASSVQSARFAHIRLPLTPVWKLLRIAAAKYAANDSRP